MPRKPSDASRKRAERAEAKDLVILPPASPDRRLEALADPFAFLTLYFPTVFYQPFTPTRREMLTAILAAGRYGGDQSIAGPRGDGKTRLALFGSLYLTLRSELTFPIVISKSGHRAARELRNLKEAMRDSVLLAADFPEVLTPIHDLGGWSSRARQQTAFGMPTNMEWGAEAIVLPTIRTELLAANGWPSGIESAARAQIVASLGIGGPIRGYSVRNRRPDAAIIDDIDSRESAESELQTESRERIIEEDIAGLAGPDKTLGRIMLCTLINQTCVAAKYTDRTAKPSWRGQRHKLLEQPPMRADLWQEYISLRSGRGAEDPDARAAHRFYLENREAMDFGAVVSNPFRFDARPLADGMPNEVSALQACFNIIADRGPDHFETEYQNNPPEETGPVESGIHPRMIQRQLSGLPRGIIPEGCVCITQGIDVGKWRLHYVVRAWKADASSCIIDYGISDVANVKLGSDEGLDRAIGAALIRRMDEFKTTPYCRQGGEMVAEVLTLCDASYRTDAVYSACASIGMGIYPIQAFGVQVGSIRANFSPAQKRTADTIPGDGWKMVRRGQIWLVESDAARWKAFEHDRWMTAKDRPGCAFLFGQPSPDPQRMSDDEKSHGQIAHHVCAEVEVEEVVKGVLRRRWKQKAKENHWLDACAYSNVGASMKGIRLPGPATANVAGSYPSHPAADTEKPLTLRQMAEAAKRR